VPLRHPSDSLTLFGGSPTSINGVAVHTFAGYLFSIGELVDATDHHREPVPVQALGRAPDGFRHSTRTPLGAIVTSEEYGVAYSVVPRLWETAVASNAENASESAAVDPSGTPSGDCVDVPVAGYPFELVGAAVGQLDSGAGDEVLDGTAYEHVSRFGERSDACAGVHGDSAHGAIC
jgi:hypothetical protein